VVEAVTYHDWNPTLLVAVVVEVEAMVASVHEEQEVQVVYVDHHNGDP